MNSCMACRIGRTKDNGSDACQCVDQAAPEPDGNVENKDFENQNDHSGEDFGTSQHGHGYDR